MSGAASGREQPRAAVADRLPWWLRALWLLFLAWGALYVWVRLAAGSPP